MSIIRGPRPQVNFTVFANELLNDESLSADALGVLVHLLSKPESWKVNVSYLKNRFGCGKDKIYRILNDLQESGYASIVREHDGDGKFLQNGYVIHEKGSSPHPENPEVASLPLPVQPLPDNPPLQKKESTKDGSKKRPARQDVNARIEYSEEFETKVWQLWPRREGSKKKAYDYWNMLNDENRAKVIAAIPLFAARMKREGRPNDKIPHLTSWFNGREYETVSSPPVAARPAAPQGPWYKTATREQWVKVLEKWQQLGRWSEAWGPEPGYGGCHVPADLVAAHNLKYRSHLFRQSDLDKFKRLLEPRFGDVSKHAVDIAAQAVP